MHLLDITCVTVGFFLKLHAMFPNSGIRARSMRRWYARVEHKELWVVVVILLTTNILFWFGIIVGWSGPDQPYMSTHMRPVPPTDMQLFLYQRWLGVSVSPTLVESSLTTAGPWRSLKRQTGWITVVVLCRYEWFLLVTHRSHVKLATTK